MIAPSVGSGGPGSSPSTSHSFSHTRRPIGGQLHRARRPAEVDLALHDADEAPLEGARAAPTSAAPPGRPRARRPPRRPPAAARGVPMPPAGSGDPKRHARTQYHPRSSIGSPRWASSQSSTPTQALGADHEVAEAEVAVDHGAPRRGRAMLLEPAQAELHRRQGRAQRRRPASASRRAGRRPAAAGRRPAGSRGSPRGRRRPGP